MVFNGGQETNPFIREDGIEKSVPRNHRLSSFDKPRDASDHSDGFIFSHSLWTHITQIV